MRKSLLLFATIGYSSLSIAQYVGIGTTTPGSGLELRGTGLGSQQRITDPTSGNTLVLQSGVGSNLKLTGYNYGTGTAQPIYIGVDGANTLVNANGGSLGVGTSSPSARLHVNGTSWFTGDNTPLPASAGQGIAIGHTGGNGYLYSFDYASFTARNLLLQSPGGSIGVGTTTPTGGYLVDVAGPVKSFGNTTHFVAQTTGGTNSWARYYMRSSSQSWFIGTSQNYVGNQLYIGDETYGLTRFSIQPNGGALYLQGGVGINTLNTTGYALAVNGNIRSKEVIVETGWADYVFEKDYFLKPLSEVEDFIRQHKHLPNIPSAKEIETNGLALGEMQKNMMEKIEELTLYIIDLKKEVEQLKNKEKE